MVWSVAGPREGPGGPPPYFKTKPRPEGAPFFENRPPHLFKGLDDRPPLPYPTPYLKVSGSSTAGSFEG